VAQAVPVVVRVPAAVATNANSNCSAVQNQDYVAVVLEKGDFINKEVL
jgi:hypothetical protein